MTERIEECRHDESKEFKWKWSINHDATMALSWRAAKQFDGEDYIACAVCFKKMQHDGNFMVFNKINMFHEDYHNKQAGAKSGPCYASLSQTNQQEMM